MWAAKEGQDEYPTIVAVPTYPVTILDEISYAYAQWDGNYSPDELSDAAQALFRENEDQYFISWLTGSIEPKTGGMGNHNNGMGNEGESAGDGASVNSAAYHMASFDYAYNCMAVMEWLFQN